MLTIRANKILFALCSALGLLLVMTLGSSAPFAASELNAPLNVSANVVAGCSNLSPQALGFGNYVAGGGDVFAGMTATALVRVTCANGVPWNLDANGGLNPSLITVGGISIPTGRRMSGPTSGLLSYDLFLDPAHTVRWGATFTSGAAQLGNGTGAEQQITIHGQIPALQSPPVGLYTDTVTVVLSF